ncbi:MAG TPA: YceI family protein [Actinocrinis sp.]|nr:YceI family protein [Actinocrinis sp.]
MSASQIPGYISGTWTIDPAHSEIGFTVRHMMVSKVRGQFGTFEGTIVTAEDPKDSSATAVIDLGSITTNNEQRDGHLRSADFFDSDSNPKMTFQSTSVRASGDHFVAVGDLTIRGITKSVELQVELNGFSPDPYGGTRAGLTATGQINRSDYGVTWNAAIEGGGVVVSEKVQLVLEIEAVLDKA